MKDSPSIETLLVPAKHIVTGEFAFPWTPDQGDGTYRNPIIHADYSDPDVVRVGDVFYMVSSSFNCTPGLPLLRSHDLVNWTIIGHAVKNLPRKIRAMPKMAKPGNGVDSGRHPWCTMEDACRSFSRCRTRGHLCCHRHEVPHWTLVP